MRVFNDYLQQCSWQNEMSKSREGQIYSFHLANCIAVKKKKSHKNRQTDRQIAIDHSGKHL